MWSRFCGLPSSSSLPSVIVCPHLDFHSFGCRDCKGNFTSLNLTAYAFKICLISFWLSNDCCSFRNSCSCWFKDNGFVSCSIRALSIWFSSVKCATCCCSAWIFSSKPYFELNMTLRSFAEFDLLLFVKIDFLSRVWLRILSSSIWLSFWNISYKLVCWHQL